MFKKLKIWKITLGLVLVYVAVCVICSLSYSRILDNLILSENLIFKEYLTTYNSDDDIFTIHVKDQNIVFSRITHTYISPFYIVKIPHIEFEYVYNISEPNESTHIEGNQAYNIVDFLQKDSFIAKTYTINEPKRSVTGKLNSVGFSPFFFGYCNNDFTIVGVDDYKLQHKIDNGYIFAFYREGNEDFDESMYTVAY